MVLGLYGDTCYIEDKESIHAKILQVDQCAAALKLSSLKTNVEYGEMPTHEIIIASAEIVRQVREEVHMLSRQKPLKQVVVYQ
jgi:hypothetical protein